MKVLITGASSGIGKDMTKILKDKYDEMILLAKNEERLIKLKEELGIKNAKLVAMDLSKQENCIKLYEENKNIDLLINNAGFGDAGFFYETSLEKDTNMINTNILVYHTLMKLYLADMIKNNKGHILNVASIAGFSPGPLMATYYATKAYIVRLSEGVREEFKRLKSNVKISILCPGPFETNFEDVANVNFKIPKMKSYDVAKYALNHLNIFYIVPGFRYKLAKFLTHISPTTITSKIIYHV